MTKKLLSERVPGKSPEPSVQTVSGLVRLLSAMLTIPDERAPV